MALFPPVVSLPEASFRVVQTPAVGRRRGSIVLLPELWGIVPQILATAARFAAEGFDVYVPELLAGEIEPTAEREAVAVRYAAADDALAVKKIAYIVDALRGDGDRGPIVAVGFCYGGRMALHAAARTRVDAAVSFYGTLAMPAALRPLDPRRALLDAAVPVQAHYGADDPAIPFADVELIRHSLRRGTVFVYEGAGHAFMNETRDSFCAEQAAVAWGRVLDFLLTQESAYRMGRGHVTEKEPWEHDVLL